MRAIPPAGSQRQRMPSQSSVFSGADSRDARPFHSCRLHASHKFLPYVFFAIALTMSANSSRALDRSKKIDQYGHETWTSQNGLPGEAVYQILQTPDGYLWLRTSAGLVRFDGVRFVLIPLTVGGVAVNEPVGAICKSADGDLLIRTTTRTILYKGGAFSDYRPPAPLPDGAIRSLFESREHDVLLGADDFIYRVQASGIRMVLRGTGFVNNTFVQDEKGIVWIGGKNSIFNYQNGELSTWQELHASGPDEALIEDRGRNLWMGTETGLYRINRDGHVMEAVARQAIHGEVRSILEDHDGSLWVGTTASGVYRLQGGQIASFNSSGGLTDNQVLSLYEGREGSLWVGTANGLDRFRNTTITTFTTKEGLPSNNTTSVIETQDGSVFVFCGTDGLARIKNGVVTRLGKKEGLPSSYGYAIFEGKDGSLWIGSRVGLSRYKDGKFTDYGRKGLFPKVFVSAINEDEQSLIVTTSAPEAVVLRFKDGKISPFTLDGQKTPLSKIENYTFTVYRDPSGTLWFGTVPGLFKFAKGEPLAKAYQKQINFPVTSIFDDQHGSLWLGGRTPGLTRLHLRDGRVTHYTSRAGLFDGALTCVLSDDDGNLWISTPNGIYRASRKELDDFADGHTTLIHPDVYGTADGMKTSEAPDPNSQPGGWRTWDGKLWFATRRGVVVIDPKHLLHNDLVPPVVIESVAADGKPLTMSKSLEVSPGSSRIEIHYTGLSLAVPGRVRFKFKLEGYDRDWVDAGTRRVAYYTNLSPGKYHFRVIASNNDGVWNLEGATVGLLLKPHFYQR